ncbi:Chemotaxis signal transduction protein [Candidatus Terasakiella magnetica]|nr:Chemotaxis signal transduction protein [Candidatus Terasakiella magnetica]
MGGLLSGADISDLCGLVTFRLSGMELALPVGAVREVAPVARLDRSPHMPNIVEGVLNLAGEAVAVLRLDHLLALEPGVFGLDASILLMRGGARPLGLLVEHVDGVRPLTDFSTMGSPPDQSFNGCLAADLEYSGRIIHLLSWPNLLLAEERDRLADFQSREQARLDQLGSGDGPIHADRELRR